MVALRVSLPDALTETFFSSGKPFARVVIRPGEGDAGNPPGVESETRSVRVAGMITRKEMPVLAD